MMLQHRNPGRIRSEGEANGKLERLTIKGGPPGIIRKEEDKKKGLVVEETMIVLIDPSDPSKTVLVGNLLPEEEKQKLIEFLK